MGPGGFVAAGAEGEVELLGGTRRMEADPFVPAHETDNATDAR